jgi:hypothetical protein
MVVRVVMPGVGQVTGARPFCPVGVPAAVVVGRAVAEVGENRAGRKVDHVVVGWRDVWSEMWKLV